MTFTLFDTETPAAISAPADQTESTGVDIAESISIVDAVTQKFTTALEKAIECIPQLQALKSNTFGADFCAFGDAIGSIPDADDLNKEVYEAIIQRAKELELAAPGEYGFDKSLFESYLTGLDPHYRRKERGTRIAVDIAGLCNAIYERYSGENGAKHERRRIAKALVDAFDLARQEIVENKGTVELRMRMYISKDYNGKYKWDYSDQRRIYLVLQNLTEAFNEGDMTVHLFELKNALSTSHTFYPEPGRTAFEGTVGGQPVRIKVHKEELRWKFPKACVDALGDFISQNTD